MKKSFTLLLFSVVLFVSAQQVSFAPYVVHTMTGSMFQFVVSGDIDGDGDTDIVGATTSYFDPSNDRSLFIWLNENGVLSTTPIKIPYTGGNDVIKAIAMRDLDSQPGDEFIVLQEYQVSVWKYYDQNNIGNNFSFYTGTLPDGVDIGDVDGDGKLDITVSHWNSPWISVLYNENNDFSFTKIDYPMANAGYDQILVDKLGNDTTNSIVFMRGQGLLNDVEILKVGSDRNIVSNVSINLPPDVYRSANGIAIGDPFGNGDKKLSITNGGNISSATVSVWDNDSSVLSHQSLYHMPETIRYANVDGIVGDEMLVVHGGWMKLSVINNAGQISQFDLPYSSNYQPTGMTTGDFNNDGKLDVAIADYNQGLVILYNTTSTLGLVDNNQVSTGVYPNPTTDLVTVSSSAEILFISVYDIHGRKIQDTQNPVVDLSQKSQGVYLLVITQKDGGVFSKKVIKK